MKFTGLVVFVLALLVGGVDGRADEVPLPVDAVVVSPEANVPPEVAAYSGIWLGTWDGVLRHILVVESVRPPSSTAKDANVVYAWGKASEWRIRKGGWSRVPGDFENGKLIVRLKRGAKVIYRMRPDGTLRASYERTDLRKPYWATLRRIKE